jgi:hypothetical protein
MRRFLVLSVLVFFPLVLVADEESPPAGWKAYAGGYKKAAYVVWLPANGTLDEKESNIVGKFGQIRVFRTVCERKDGSVFGAGQIRLPPKLVKEQPKVRQDFFRDSFLKEIDGKLLEEKRIKLGTMAGREYLIKTPKGMARYRLFGTGVLLFRVFVIGSKEQVTGKEGETLFNSFKRTPPPPKKEKEKEGK